MKRKVLIFIALFLPLQPMYAQEFVAATAPKTKASTSQWLSWFKSLRRPTMQDVRDAQAFVKSKWRCMTGRKRCSKKERNTLRALSAAAAAALAWLGYSLRQGRAEEHQDAGPVFMTFEDMARQVADRGVDPQGITNYGAFVDELREAVDQDDLDRVKQVVEKNKEVVDPRTSTKASLSDALRIAVVKNKRDLARKLIQSGVEVDISIWIAVINLDQGFDAMVEMFLEEGADINKRGKYQETPLMEAVLLARRIA